MKIDENTRIVGLRRDKTDTWEIIESTDTTVELVGTLLDHCPDSKGYYQVGIGNTVVVVERPGVYKKVQREIRARLPKKPPFIGGAVNYRIRLLEDD